MLVKPSQASTLEHDRSAASATGAAHTGAVNGTDDTSGIAAAWAGFPVDAEPRPVVLLAPAVSWTAMPRTPG
jgi:Na+/H+ antiporter NhaC